ncbi:MAG: hypothetical protein JWP97_3734 [Labilithrix sp.]|nr:hypothetical protein [Labilithrix sp.]
MTTKVDHVARAARAAALLLVAVAFFATLAWTASTLAVRPLDGVEGDVLFEADRLRVGLRLYTDPAAGAFDYGPVPARFLVLYPPLWSALLSRVPSAGAALVGRSLGLAAWAGILAWITLRAPREHRRAAAIGAACIFATWVLTCYASARPDALAVMLCGLAVERAARRGAASAHFADSVTRLDPLVGVLLTLAAWVKPNVVGAAPGIIVGAVLASRASGVRLGAAVRGVLPAVASALLTAGLVAGVLTALTGRAWLAHLLFSTGQPPSGALWREQVLSRAPFAVAPFAFLLVLGLRARERPGAVVALTALVTSLAWTVLCLAKIGSASNYFMEPAVVGLVVLAHAGAGGLGPRARLVVSFGALAQAAWSGVASVRSSIDGVARSRAASAALASARATCGAAPGDLVMADEPGLERMLDGRILSTPFQLTHLARAGRFDESTWASDVTRPEVTCLVMQDDLLERPLARESREHDRFGPVLRRAFVARFELARAAGGLRIYRLRQRP